MQQDQEIEQKIIRWLDDSVERLDAETKSKLTQARYLAVEAGNRSPVFRRWIAPAGGLASVAVLAMMLTLNQSSQTPASADSVWGDMDVLAAAEELEFYEDIEFYQWLDGELPSPDDAENV